MSGPAHAPGARPARRGPGAVGTAVAVVAGVAAGLVAERRLVRPLLVPGPDAVVRAAVDGERLRVTGPAGLAVAVERHGPADAPQVVLVHGWLCSTRVWAAQVRDLSDRVRLVAHDQPGHGGTPAPTDGRYDLDLLGDVLARVVEEATVPGPLVLVGHSLGGMTVLNAMRRHAATLAPRVGGVVLLSTSARIAVDERTAARATRATLLRIAAAARDRRVVASIGRARPATSDAARLVMRAVGLGPAADAAMLELLAGMVADAGPDPLLGLAPAILGLDERAALPTLPPTTALVGALDRLTPPSHTRRMAAEAPGVVAAEVLPGVGHLTPLEAPEAVAAAVMAAVAAAARRVPGAPAGRSPSSAA